MLHAHRSRDTHVSRVIHLLMGSVTIRDLRNHGGDVIDRVLSGESVVITRAGVPVAELHALPTSGFDAATILDRSDSA